MQVVFLLGSNKQTLYKLNGQLSGHPVLLIHISKFFLIHDFTANFNVYRVNHPHARVYNQSVKVCLKHAILTSEGKNPPLLMSRSKHSKQLPPMPKPGEVDFIYGGKAIFPLDTPVLNIKTLQGHHARVTQE